MVAVAEFGGAAGGGGEAEEIGEGGKSGVAGGGGELRGPAHEKRDATGGLEETFFLPRTVVAHVVAVVGEKADERVGGVGAGLDGVEDFADALFDEGDRAGVTRAELAGLGPGAPRTLRERSRQAELQAQQVALERRLSELRLWLKAHAAV